MSDLSNNYLLYYNNFLDILLSIFDDDVIKTKLLQIKSDSDLQKIKNGELFNNSISQSNFKNFLESKIKLVSHKSDNTLNISQSLFNNQLCLKDILNNQTTQIKKIIWNQLHILYLNYELLKPDNLQNKQHISQLNNLLNIKNDKNDKNVTTQTIQEMLNIDVNNNTNDMLDDIVGSFQNILHGENPMNGILDVSKIISQKYADKINNGDIELDKLMESITKKVPCIGEMMKMMPTSNTQTTQSSSFIMDESFSTASVPLGNNEQESTSNINIGNMLKMADGMGIIPNLTSNTQNNTNIPGMDNIQTLLGFVKKIDNSQNQENMDDVKDEMNTFFQNNLGINIEQFNEDINKIM